MDAWVGSVSVNGLTVSYSPVGSTTGRTEFKNYTVNYGASEIPYGVKDGNNFDPPPARGYAYMPDTAGGTALMYNLMIGTHKVTNLRLSGKAVADIFTGVITKWNDPEIKADNPQLNLPPTTIIPVVRSDGSGSTAEFTKWMDTMFPAKWQAYCSKTGFNPCTPTSGYPPLPHSAMVEQQGDLGVSGYVRQGGANGAIGYTEFSYALTTGFPVAKLLNAAGYYTEPTYGHVAVSLLDAQINTDVSSVLYLTQDLSKVYTDTDPRTYELSSYSYMILPTDGSGNFTNAQGYTLAAFGTYVLCQGQTQVDQVGYSALPIDLVQRGYAQLRRIPGNQVPSTSGSFIQNCNNPTFSPNGFNELAKTDPFPPACDKIGRIQCSTPTGGANGANSAGGTNGNNGGGTNGGGNNGGGANNGGNGNNGGGGNNGGNNSTGHNGEAVANSTVPSCDPNTGICSAGGGSSLPNSSGSGALANGGTVDGVDVASSSSLGDGVEVMLMALAAALLLGLCVVPPLVAQTSASRQRRRRGDWSGSQDGPR